MVQKLRPSFFPSKRFMKAWDQIKLKTVYSYYYLFILTRFTITDPLLVASADQKY